MNTQRVARFVGFAALSLSAAMALANDIKVYVNGDPVTFAYEGPRMIGNRVLVPLRGVFERLGASVDWNEREQTVSAQKQAKSIWLKIGDNMAKVDGMDVHLDQPAILYRGTTMVPLRFVGESFGADVLWNDSQQAVLITTSAATTGNTNNNGGNNDTGSWRQVVLETGTVIPLTLQTELSSRTAQEGDKFTATVDTKGKAEYAGLPQGTTVLGHVTLAKPKTSKDPGVLALDYDALVTPDGTRIPIQGSLIGLDDKSVENKDDRIIARTTKNNDHKSVWIGAGAGAVLALVTKGNLLTNSVVGAALGYLYETLNIGGSKSNDVVLDSGTTFGVKLERNLVARINPQD